MISLPGGKSKREIHRQQRTGAVHVRLGERDLVELLPLVLQFGQGVVEARLIQIEGRHDGFLFLRPVLRPVEDVALLGRRIGHGRLAAVDGQGLRLRRGCRLLPTGQRIAARQVQAGCRRAGRLQKIPPRCQFRIVHVSFHGKEPQVRDIGSCSAYQASIWSFTPRPATPRWPSSSGPRLLVSHTSRSAHSLRRDRPWRDRYSPAHSRRIPRPPRTPPA